uniref:Uncharacterized protein n=1 Tax=Ralstonia solanacearum TaxID=305 RepID=A0A0S4URE6_RALSL|nr:protein of unknown function [Ralstonia solanacearum]CUV32968.1 protein of unknown function [Ralstonia solanacearum]CUV37785.1 protein of unknown function [Ralstonia solanacearum]CUV64067.1 protein of unknown function [Ralstonia solanacearum]
MLRGVNGGSCRVCFVGGGLRHGTVAFCPPKTCRARQSVPNSARPFSDRVRFCGPRAWLGAGDERRSVSLAMPSGCGLFIEHRPRRVFALPVCCNAQGGGVIYREGARGSAAGAVPELAWRGGDRVPGSGMEQVRSAAFDGRGMGREGREEGRIAAPHIAARQPWGDLSAGALVQLSHPAAGLDMQLQGALGFTAHDLPETAETGSGRDTEGEGFHGSSFFVEPREYPDASRNIAMQQISLPQCRGVATSSCVGGG